MFVAGPFPAAGAGPAGAGGRAEPAGAVAGLISGYRIVGTVAWYWAALVRSGRPLVAVSDWAIPARPDPLLVKSAGLWAEHICDAPLEQWTIANETYGVALDDPDEALDRAYGVPTAIAWDLEWYAVADAVEFGAAASAAVGAVGPSPERAAGYHQRGVVHGRVELAGVPPLEIVEAPSQRWHRWGEALAPVGLPPASGRDGLRAPFRFPDATMADWVLTPDGWHSR